jgi:hypothetical protein
LAGNGLEDAVVFLRGETDNLLAVFLQGDGEFIALPPVAENAESVHSVMFSDLNGDGKQEIIVGWQIQGLRSLSVYTLDTEGLAEIYRCFFSAFTVYDIEEAGTPALLVARMDAAEQVVEMVTDHGGELLPAGTAYLSAGAEAVQRIRTGPLLDGKPGLLIASRFPLDDQTTGEVTDVLTFRDGNLVNISADMETGVSSVFVRHREFPAADIGNDGVLKLPRLTALPRHPDDSESGDSFYEIRWIAYESGGISVETARTYHSVNNNWYILIPEHWPERYTVRRELVSAAQFVTIFSRFPEGGEPADFLRIYALPQSAAARPPVRDRTVLAEQDNLLITAEIIPEQFSLTEQELKAIFYLNPADWGIP